MSFFGILKIIFKKLIILKLVCMIFLFMKSDSNEGNNMNIVGVMNYIGLFCSVICYFYFKIILSSGYVFGIFGFFCRV